MSEKLYKFDPKLKRKEWETQARGWAGSYAEWELQYLKAHEITPDQVPRLFGSVDELWDWFQEQGWVVSKHNIKLLLDRFGMQWVDGATSGNFYQFKGENCIHVSPAMKPPHPAPTKTERIQAIAERIQAIIAKLGRRGA